MIADNYHENTDEAVQIARQALPMASRFSLPVNPVNYAVLYEYFSGSNAKLTEAIDRKIEQTSRLTQEFLNGLFQEHLAEHVPEDIQRMRADLRKMLVTTLTTIRQAENDASRFNSSLSGDISQIENMQRSDDLQLLTEQVVRTTRRMQESSRELHNRLHATSEEIETLRRDIVEVRQESLIDPLTKISNRRAFEQKLAELCTESQNSGQPLALLMIDIDHFKGINDRFGHVIGDDVLRYVAKAISQMVRGGDFIARYGGEEFAVMLPNTPLNGAELVGNNIRRNLSSSPLKHQGNGRNIGIITASIGIAIWRKGEEGTHWVGRADSALYQAKNNGRNQVCLATES